MTTSAETAAVIHNVSFTEMQNAVCGGLVDGQRRHEHPSLDLSPHGNTGNKYLALDLSWGREKYGGRRLKMAR